MFTGRKKAAPPGRRGRFNPLRVCELPAEMFLVSIPIPITVPVSVKAPVKVPAPITVPAPTPAPIVAGRGKAIPIADEGPSSGDPISPRVISCHPNVSRTRARRKIGCRSTSIDSELSRLGRSRSCAQPACHHRRSQHPVPHVTHDLSIPAGIFGASPAWFRLGLDPAALRPGQLWTGSTAAARKGCA